MNHQIISSLLLALALYGCAAPAPSVSLPPDAPAANVRSALFGAANRNESLYVYVLEGECGANRRRILFYVKGSKSTPDGYVRVDATKPLRLLYDESASGGRSCRISVEATLEQGKSYSLVGGFDYKSGPLPIITGSRGCTFGIVDEIDKKPVALQPYCARY